jgi:hypothetical protein
MGPSEKAGKEGERADDHDDADEQDGEERAGDRERAGGFRDRLLAGQRAAMPRIGISMKKRPKNMSTPSVAL